MIRSDQFDRGPSAYTREAVLALLADMIGVEPAQLERAA